MEYGRYKMCIFGDGGVGKTTLVNRYISGKYSEEFKMTIGVDFYTKTIEIEGKRVYLQIWDFGGEHQFKHLFSNYVVGSSGGIYVYDISRFSSLTNLDDWLGVLKKAPDEEQQFMPILLVGGKSDLDNDDKRVIESEYADNFRKKRNLFEFIECSSKTGVNVDQVFDVIARKMMKLSGLL